MMPVLIVAAILGFLGTLVAREIAIKVGLVSHPNTITRDTRTVIPYMGGLGILAGAYATMGLLPMIPGALPAQAHAGFPLSLVIGGALFCAVGAVDDVRAFSARRKFALQLASVAAVFLVADVTGGPDLVHVLTGWPAVDAVFSALWILTLVNAVNFVDVSDGLAAAVSAVLIVFFAWFFSPYAALALAVSGACAGFLVLNRAPATVFMGDAGSHFLGFMLGVFTLTESTGSRAWPWVALLGLWTSVPIFELVFLTVVRVRKGLPWWKGSPDHFALRLQAAGLSKNQVAITAAAAGAVFWIASIVFVGLSPSMQLIVTLLCAAVAGEIARRLLRMEVPSKSTTLA